MARKYFNAKRMTGFEWDVQPYRWLEDMRNNYTETVIATTKYKMGEQSKEATAWMQQNAVWTDRTPDERTRQDGRNHQSARKGLKADVEYTEKERDIARLGLIKAKNLDLLLLNKINAQRKQEAEASDKKKIERMEENYARLAYGRGITKGDDETRFRVKSSYIPISKLQPSQSHLPEFSRQFHKDFRLIGTIKFHYNKYRTYAIWLEVANGGRFGIISRALQYWSAKMNTEIKRIANLKQFQHISFSSQVVSQAEQFEEFTTKELEQTGRVYKPFSRAVQAERSRRRRGRRKKAAKTAR